MADVFGAAIINSGSQTEVFQDLIFSMSGTLGRTKMFGGSSLEASGGIYGTQYSSALLSGGSSLAVEGLAIAITRGASLIQSGSNFFAFAPVPKLSLEAQVRLLTERVEALEEAMANVTQGDNLLTADDIQPLFNGREVIFDV